MTLPANTTTAVIFASLTGDAEQVAKDTVEILGAEELGPYEFPEFQLADLERLTDAMFVVSTYNWGEPPGASYHYFAQHIWKDVYHNGVEDWRKLSLGKLRFSLVALGDKSYLEEFCLFGKNLDTWLRACGATRVGEITTVDQVNERDVQRWFRVAKQHWNLTHGLI